MQLPVQHVRRLSKNLVKSIWLFPCVLTLLLILLTAFKVSGSSIGLYHDYFYAGATKDHALIFGKPRAIRSDEFLVNTQMALGQSKVGYSTTNTNIGVGEDMATVGDIPNNDWSEIFRPHNWSFFIMPFDYAFAFKWWVMAYFLLLSTYFFVLALLPRKRLLATLIALSLFLSPFIHWWYQFVTLGALYYPLAILTLFIHLLKAKCFRIQALLTIALAYLLTAYVQVIYPPFQVATALAAAAFTIGFIIEEASTHSPKSILKPLALSLAAVIVAGVLSLLFLHTHQPAVNAIEHTVYPGKRDVLSGGFSPVQLLSGHLDFQLQSTLKAVHLKFNGAPINQSEASSFLLFSVFLVLPSAYLLARLYRRKHEIDWPLLTVTLGALLFLARMLVPYLSPVYKILLLNKVPHNRLVIGLGLLGFIHVILFIRHYLIYKPQMISRTVSAIYCVLIYAVEYLVAYKIVKESPGFIGFVRAAGFSLIIPTTVLLLLRKRFVPALILVVGCSLLMVVRVNPLYRGTAVLSSTPLSTAIIHNDQRAPARWITDELMLENLAVVNGASSLTGVYEYPQPTLWQSIGQPSVYNRYAHVYFKPIVDKPSAPAKLEYIQADSFVLSGGICSNYLRQENVGYFISLKRLNGPCINDKTTIVYPAKTFYIYKLF